MRPKLLPAMAVGLALSACAGRDPQPIASVQAQDGYSDCTMIRAEIEANNVLGNFSPLLVCELAGFGVAAGVAGLIIWPIWFGMDFKDAAGKEAR